MTGEYIAVVVGGTEILVEATPVRVSGSEPTAADPGRLAGRVRDAFEEAQSTIVGIAQSTVTAMQGAGRAVQPDAMEVEFALKFSAKGDVILAGAAGEAALKVKLVWDGRDARQRNGEEPDGEAP
ncbi:hypothetical protein ACM01_12825 [Streptomyces viridochromogenes]|uniref:Trypsin-co-occurring domain-containing protein n=1 Tax=Streptomyces viridochromogenes TaxID=1938 RepID=A0A0J7ZFA0_STRVR|nr:CU044_2847 family protein [Streptomyces viridochromogenes]KMS74801.1 hypothetical protein ACM01_12825 [Streptomyces viridochromogenes]KOG14860.1 hypothetical protein ADK36_30370 [Streptomyces viridochromogenes]KOG15054.1 hypothetical protein ADK35_30015 [Streptomyces viridochromogenes]